MTSFIDKLPILILSPHSRCNCRCLMCDIWKTTEAIEMSEAELDRHLSSLESARVEWVVFSGGEPLMHSDLFRLCAQLRKRRIRTTLLSTGLLLKRHVRNIVDWIDDVIVSLDGPPSVHDRIRGVPGAFRALESGVRAIHEIHPGFPLTARCTVQRLNCTSLTDTADAARAIGLQGISFLAADLTSEAFNHVGGWPEARQSGVALGGGDIPLLEAQIEKLLASNPDGFVAESRVKLARILQHFRAHLGDAEAASPSCNAPWVSAVVEADGTVRPCFFHPAIGKATAEMPLFDVLNSKAATEFRRTLDVQANPVCRRCVCSLNWQGALVRPKEN